MSPLKKLGLVAAGIFLVAGVATVLLAKMRAPEQLPLPYRQAVSRLVASYSVIQKDLANDDLKSAKEDLKELRDAASGLYQHGGVDGLNPEQELTWKEGVAEFFRRSDSGGKFDLNTLAGFRKVFKEVSDALIPLVEKFGNAHYTPIYVMHCSMAFNNTGADWLQTSDKLRNPYFGAEMLECGKIVRTIPAGR